jgi:hypothetical protein
MGHDHNGRVGPPRCEECNTPLSSDERRLDSTSTRFLCLECQLALPSLPCVGRPLLPCMRTQTARRDY